VVELLQEVRPGPVLDELYVLALKADLTDVPPVDDETATRMTTRYRWLIERLGADGVQLTSAGRFQPAMVEEIMTELRLEPDWIGKANREAHTFPVALFRQCAHALGLIRKLKGRLTVPARIRPLAIDPRALWWHTATRMPLGRQGTAQRHASLLALLWTAAGESVHSREFSSFAVEAMSDLGWQSGGQPLESWQVRRLADLPMGVLDAMSAFAPHPRGSFEQAVTPGGVLLARSALITEG
jgi:hypothetical protein